ncbi:MAG: mechanosensitive ion channel [Myxococcales bacterium]|nr:MAG: mechanosensitive ion channel [Myxococcales bacterium]
MTSSFDAWKNSVSNWVLNPNTGRLLTALILLVATFAAVRIIQRFATRYIEDKDNRYRIRKLVAVVGYLLGALGIASIFSDKLSQLTVMLGVAGAGIAFALQEVIMSIAGWTAVSLGGFYKTGDRVQLGGIKGDVIDIGLLRTTLSEIGQWVDGDLYNGRFVRVANSFVFKAPVVNYSGDFPFLWDEITVPIRFGSDRSLVQQILEHTVDEVCGHYENESSMTWKAMQKRYPLESATTKPLITMGFDHNWITYTLRYTVRFDQRRVVKHKLFSRILEKLHATKGKACVASSAMNISVQQTEMKAANHPPT